MNRPNAVITIASTKRVLIIEDNTMRNRWFVDHIDAYKTVCTTPKAGLDALKNGCPYDIVFHDFDSGPNMWNGGDLSDTFDAVTQRLVELDFRGVVVVHSLNPAGAERIKNALRHTADVHVHPFGSFDIRMGGREQ